MNLILSKGGPGCAYIVVGNRDQAAVYNDHIFVSTNDGEGMTHRHLITDGRDAETALGMAVSAVLEIEREAA